MQMDVKIKWLKMEVFEKAFIQGEEASSFILNKMLEIQPKVEVNLSKYAPLIMNIKVPEDKIREIIGKWGSNIQRMEKEYNVKLSIADDWSTTITADSQAGWLKAIEDIKQILWVPKVWDLLSWAIVKIIDWVWVIVEFKGKSGMIHISKLAETRVANVEDVVKVGEVVDIEVIQVDIMKWRIGLKKMKK